MRMMNDAAGACKVGEAMKPLSMEGLDEFPGKRFDTDGRLLWNRNTRARYEEVRPIIKANAQ